MNKNLKVLSLFSGIGAFEKALEKTSVNFNLVGFSEIDKYATTSYCAIHNVDESLNLGDVSKISDLEIPNCDLITYGFPCQDISIAGLQKGIIKGETRSGLLYEALRLIKAKKPKYAIAENVKNLVGKKFKKDFENLLSELNKIGYNNYWKVLNSKNYGIPQNRERVFIISIRKDVDDDSFEFPKPFDNGLRLKDFLENSVEDKYYIDNDRVDELLNKIKNGVHGQYPNIKNEPLSSSALGSREHRVSGWSENIGTLCARDYKDPKVIAEPNEIIQINAPKHFSQRICSKEGIAPTISAGNNGGGKEPCKIICEQRTDEGLRFFKDNVCGTIRTIDSGGDKRIIEETSNELDMIGKLNREGYHDFSNRVYADTGLSRTLMGSGGNLEDKTGLYLETNNYKIRKLIPKECFRLMGFENNDFERARTALINTYYKGKDRANTQLYKQAGNSIVVNVLEAIFKNLFKDYIE